MFTFQGFVFPSNIDISGEWLVAEQRDCEVDAEYPKNLNPRPRKLTQNMHHPADIVNGYVGIGRPRRNLVKNLKQKRSSDYKRRW